MATDTVTRDAIDEIFDLNLSDFDDDPFADKPSTKTAQTDKALLTSNTSLKRKAGEYDDKENLGLGLDQEVKIVKKRNPVAKLDEARLLSEPGIPVLRKLIREKRVNRKLKLKGKGNEFTDAARLLNYFQLWLDNLYPRAKFADALQLVEKAGHTKRMQMIRNEWINESKPGYIRPDSTSIDVAVTAEEMPDLFETNNNAQASEEEGKSRPKEAQSHNLIFGNGISNDSLFIPDANKTNEDNDADGDVPDDDELDVLMAMQEDDRSAVQPTDQQDDADDSEGEDDLDALLAEQDSRQTSLKNDAMLPLNSDLDYEDKVPDLDLEDLDALLASQESRQRESPARNASIEDDSQPHSIPADLDDEDAEGNLTGSTPTTKSKTLTEDA